MKRIVLVNPDAPQRQRVLEHLVSEGSITHMEALVVLHVPRLAARICELREDGYPIRSEPRMDVAGKRYVRYHYQARKRKK